VKEGQVKRAFNLKAITADLPSLPEEGAATDNARPRVPAVPIAKAIENQHRNAMAELKALEAAIEQQKSSGLLIEEIDSGLADPSPYWDRDLRFLEDKNFASFVEDLRLRGQQSPALVRRHPGNPDRYEVCFGHRRLFACRSLGIRLRATVAPLSEAQMAGASYSENAHREGVSILEQARALARYVDRGVFASKQALADALNVSRSHVSNLTSYAEIPDRVLEALGDWRKCTFRDAGHLLKAARDPERRVTLLEAADRLIAGEPQQSFNTRLIVLLGQKAVKPASEDLRDDVGRVLAVRTQSKRSTAITFGASAARGFDDFVWSRLPTLVEEFHRQQLSRK
jgi:ParB family transcriptional regulator, chromosome partitioning protein